MSRPVGPAGGEQHFESPLEVAIRSGAREVTEFFMEQVADMEGEGGAPRVPADTTTRHSTRHSDRDWGGNTRWAGWQQCNDGRPAIVKRSTRTIIV